jgi:hypothetical protein
MGIPSKEIESEGTFGEQRSNSSSSLNSSSSRSSWADKVRGGNYPHALVAPAEVRSVDDLLQRSASAVPHEGEEMLPFLFAWSQFYCILPLPVNFIVS